MVRCRSSAAARRDGYPAAPGPHVSIGILILLSLALGVAAWLFFMWSVKSGQYEDPEGPKHRMLEDDEGVPPRREREDGEE